MINTVQMDSLYLTQAENKQKNFGYIIPLEYIKKNIHTKKLK